MTPPSPAPLKATTTKVWAAAGLTYLANSTADFAAKCIASLPPSSRPSRSLRRRFCATFVFFCLPPIHCVCICQQNPLPLLQSWWTFKPNFLLFSLLGIGLIQFFPPLYASIELLFLLLLVAYSSLCMLAVVY